MNWAAINFDWNQIRAFLATVEEGSLSAAARALGQTQPTIGRQVAALEDALGVVLFERVGKSLSLTPTGSELLIHVRAMCDAAQAISITASGQSQAIEGAVRITASDLFAVHHLPSVIAEIRAAAPRLTVDIVAANDIRDLQQREADIAIRHVRPKQPELFARLIRDATAHFYASRSYIQRKGRPMTVTDIEGHDFIGFGDTERMIAYFEPYGLSLTAEQFPISSENGLVAWEMVREGLGIAPMSDEVAARVPGMERLFPGMEPIKFPIWLTTHRELHTSRRIRLVFDILAAHFARQC